jgi:hypothetical protein
MASKGKAVEIIIWRSGWRLSASANMAAQLIGNGEAEENWLKASAAK